jgi:hypothetical protein
MGDPVEYFTPRGNDLSLYPVSLEAAEGWLKGELEDPDLEADALRPDLIPAVIYFANLPGRIQYRLALRACVFWRSMGAEAIIFRTRSPQVMTHSLALGCRISLKEPDGSLRICSPREVFSRWIASLSRCG